MQSPFKTMIGELRNRQHTCLWYDFLWFENNSFPRVKGIEVLRNLHLECLRRTNHWIEQTNAPTMLSLDNQTHVVVQKGNKEVNK